MYSDYWGRNGNEDFGGDYNWNVDSEWGYGEYQEYEQEQEFFYPPKKSKWANYKTKMGYDFLENSTGKLGDLCFYAHSYTEIRHKNSPISTGVIEMFEDYESNQAIQSSRTVTIAKETYDNLNKELADYK